MVTTSTGLRENVAGLLCYLLGWITGLVFIFIERESKFVRFHAMQSIIVFGILTIASFISGFVYAFTPVISIVTGWIITILGLVLWIILMVKAYQGTMYKLPWAGNLAEKKS